MTAHDALTRVFRAEHARVVAALARRFGDLDIAEDAVGEAVVIALERWPAEGVPPNPGGWLTTTATRRAIDRLRREAHRTDKYRQALMIADHSEPAPAGPIEDDRLRLMFTCAHPALASEARVALTLRLVAGLTVAEIAQAFLVPETTMAQRITRAKRKIRDARIPFRIPGDADLPGRLNTVLAVLYLVFNEGYLASSPGNPLRGELTAEAIRLARLLRSLARNQPEVTGLLALMLLTEARSTSRVADGALVTLADQDRAAWDQRLIAEGHGLVRECLAINRPGRYQLLAAINAVHTDADSAASTDWAQILALYDLLVQVDPGPVAALNRAVAVAEVHGPHEALALVNALPLTGYHAWHATRAELLRRLDRRDEARDAYDAALALTENDAERAFLCGRRDRLSD